MSDEKAQRWFYIALIALFIGLSVQYSMKVLKKRDDGNTRGAINRWAKQLQDMESGENIHAKYNYPNPPIMAQILWPISELASFHPLAPALVWYYLKVGMVLLCFGWAFGMIESDTYRIPVWAKMIGIALSLRPIMGDLSHGNINIFILFLVMACLYLFTRRRESLAGFVLALAIACKVTPALLVIYFLWKRSVRVLIGTAIGLVCFFFILPTLFYAIQEGSIVKGWERNWAALIAWFNGMIVPYLVNNVVTPERENQSLPGVLTRLLTHSPSFTDWVDGIYTPLAFHHIVDLNPMLIKRCVQASQLCFLLVMVWACRANSREQRTGVAVAAEFSFILVGMLLFSERTWKHHCVTLLLPFVTLVAAAFQSNFIGWRKWFIVSTLVLSSLLILSTSSGVFSDEAPKIGESHAGLTVVVGPTAYIGAVESEMTAELGLIPDSLGKMSQVYGAYMWAFLLLLCGLVTTMRQQKTT